MHCRLINPRRAWSVKMSGQKRPAVATSLASSGPAPPKKHKIAISTVENGKKSDKATVWLAYDKLNRDHVASLERFVCIQLANKI